MKNPLYHVDWIKIVDFLFIALFLCQSHIPISISIMAKYQLFLCLYYDYKHKISCYINKVDLKTQKGNFDRNLVLLFVDEFFAKEIIFVPRKTISHLWI